MIGKFVSFEGGEGCGKSTQARLLADALATRAIACKLTREPGGSPGAEAIRALLLDPALPTWEIEAEALLFAAARADHVARVIRPALAGGTWIVCDRFVDSSRAYQGAAGGMGDEAIRVLHSIGSRGLVPDRTIWLAASPALTATRISARDGATTDKIGGRSAVFHNAVDTAFAGFVDHEPARFRRVDANGTVEEVHHRVLAALDDILP